MWIAGTRQNPVKLALFITSVAFWWYCNNGVANILGVSPDKVHGIWITGPGTYGRNDAGDAAMDAALLAKAVGKPVRLQYMRDQGTGWDPKGPASIHRARAATLAAVSVRPKNFA